MSQILIILYVRTWSSVIFQVDEKHVICYLESGDHAV